MRQFVGHILCFVYSIFSHSYSDDFFIFRQGISYFLHEWSKSDIPLLSYDLEVSVGQDNGIHVTILNRITILSYIVEKEDITSLYITQGNRIFLISSEHHVDYSSYAHTNISASLGVLCGFSYLKQNHFLQTVFSMSEENASPELGVAAMVEFKAGTSFAVRTTLLFGACKHIFRTTREAKFLESTPSSSYFINMSVDAIYVVWPAAALSVWASIEMRDQIMFFVENTDASRRLPMLQGLSKGAGIMVSLYVL